MRKLPLRAAMVAGVAGIWATGSVAESTSEPAAAVEPAGEPAPLTRAELHLDRSTVQAGRPVWAELVLVNLTADPLTLQVPDTQLDNASPEQMGLPLAHVFSGTGFSALSVKDARGEAWDAQVAIKPKGPVPAVHLAPYAAVGARVEISRYYESLQRRPGKYTLVWRPYSGTVESAPVSLIVMAEQQALLLTDFGKIVIRFYYEDAPNHIQNFIDLVNQHFYDNLTFHRVVPGGLLQGGDPRGDGRGIRTDGKRLAAEFNKIPFELGTVGMARSAKDPDSASCQFFICLGRQPSFDGQQTAFGRVVGEESLATLRQIAAVPMGPRDRPQRPVYIRAVSLENVPLREREVAAGAGMGAGASRPAAPAAHSRTIELLRRKGIDVNPSTVARPPASQPAVQVNGAVASPQARH